MSWIIEGSKPYQIERKANQNPNLCRGIVPHCKHGISASIHPSQEPASIQNHSTSPSSAVLIYYVLVHSQILVLQCLVCSLQKSCKIICLYARTTSGSILYIGGNHHYKISTMDSYCAEILSFAHLLPLKWSSSMALKSSNTQTKLTIEV